MRANVGLGGHNGLAGRLRPPLDVLGTAAITALLAALLTPPLVAYEVAWEVAAALGYAGCAALILCLRAAPAPLSAYRYTLHRVAGDLAVALVTGHVAVMLAADPFVLDYLGWQAPVHVLFGMVGGAALLAALATREPVLPAGWRRGNRWLHTWLGVAAMAGIVGHLWVATAKPAAVWRDGLVVAALVVVTMPALARATGMTAAPPRTGDRGTAGMVRAVLAVLGLTAALLVAAPQLAALLRG